MPSNSRSQQRLFGWVHACQNGTAKHCPPNISKVASSISPKDAEDFARTKHDGLPERKKKGKKMKKKKRLKSYKEYKDLQVMQENLNQAGRTMAGMTMGDPNQAHQAAVQAGISTQKYFRVMSKWLNDIEQKMGLKNQQGGENANQWHQQAVQVLQSVLMAAAGGKQQWSMNQQLKNFKKTNNAATANAPAAPAVQQNTPSAQGAGGVVAGGGGGPTPLNAIN